jgi:hypothetical protein
MPMPTNAFLEAAALTAPQATFDPVAETAETRDPILSLARANGVPVDKVYEVDASRPGACFST